MRARAPRSSLSLCVLLFLAAAVLSSRARAEGRVGRTLDPVTEKALRLAEEGEKLYLARDYAQALVEYQRAHETKPSAVSLVMMAQCEYYLGLLHDARRHYEAYLADSPRGEMVEVAKDRIESINRRPATLVINSVPDEAEVRIEADIRPEGDAAEARAANDAVSGAGATVSVAPLLAPPPSSAAPWRPTPPAIVGQSPNSFSVLRGRWRLTVSKTNYVSQVRFVEVDVADTKSLFFKLDPIPAHLEVETSPPGATLFINGNRTRNPYRQDLLPGRVEIFTEALDHESRSVELVLGPSDRRLLTGPSRLELRYVQRSGRPELIASSALLGGLLGASAVAAKIGPDLQTQGVSTVTFLLGGAVTGGVLGGLLTNSLAPPYIPDNRALFLIGAMWIGTLEGAASGIVIRQAVAKEVGGTSTHGEGVIHSLDSAPEVSPYLRSAFVGSIPGLALGTVAGVLTASKAPTYGRVTLIQSATLGGALTGALLAEAFRWHPFSTKEGEVPLDHTLPTLIGFNAGLAGGLLGAYLPNQDHYGPSWRRVLLIDLGAGAGVVAGMVSGCLSNPDCYNPPKVNQSSAPGKAGPAARARTAVSGLVGGVLGAGAAWLLTAGTNSDEVSSRGGPPLQITPAVGMVQAPGRAETVPGAVLMGLF